MGQKELRGTPKQLMKVVKSQEISPIKVLDALSANYPELWKYVNTGVLDNGEFGHKGNSDGQVLLAYIAWWFIILRIKHPRLADKMFLAHKKIQIEQKPIVPIDLPFTLIPEIMAIADIGTWRYTKGIYKINDDIAPFLLNEDFKGNIPLDRISRLPEWSIYVDCRNLKLSTFGRKIVGFWASINYFPSSLYKGQEILHFTILYEDTFGTDFKTCISLDADNKSIEEDTIKISQWFKQGISDEALAELVMFKNKALQIILYICQDEPDISENGNEILDLNFNPKPQRIKGKNKLFEAKKIRYFDVGEKDGRSIKEALNVYHNSGKTQAPHIRRAHWHGFWKGSRKNNAQEFFYKWVAPVIVNGDLAQDKN
ncbi:MULTISPECIES: AcrVA2 family anti-CRISPR protein [Acinetobacter]|uniref:AcrVA2 family anti-CRISPR protein n=1 Tax=Acinetobacter TaxID=469 RepID=UPI00125064A0|nr:MULTISPECIES: hypothetical protein [Acinetobacter]MDO6643818.1 hypothetical protein [Acinetobacter guillouiae]